LKSLKQIIELGEIISGKPETSVGPQVTSSRTPAVQRRQMSAVAGSKSAIKTPRSAPAAVVDDSSPATVFRVPVKNTYTETVRYRSPPKRDPNAAGNRSTMNIQQQGPKLAQRRTAPGTTPDESKDMRKTPRKVFGHPI
jgi:hypothetical protein